MLEKLSAIILSLYRGSCEMPMAGFQEWAFESLRNVIAFDSGVWMTGVLNVESDTATFHTRYLCRQPLQLLADYNRCKDATFFSKKVFASPGVALTCTPSVDFGPELAVHSRRYGIEQVLATTQVEPVAGLHELISLYRSDIAHPFSEEERLFQQCLVPHLSEAWRACRMRHLSHLSQPSCALKAQTAAADMQGLLSLIDPGFTRLLREEWPEWRGPQLPEDIFSAYAHGELRYVGQRAAFSLVGVHDHILLRGRLKIPLDELSRREREIAEHFAAGHSHKEIAKSIWLSPATVRNHLSAIYLKLGIDNKAALTAVIREHQ